MAISWNAAYEDQPGVDDSPSLGYVEFNDLKENIRLRFANEHRFQTANPATDQQGWHKQGSALVYFGTTAPSTRPDGITAFTTDDLGRLWYNPVDESLHILTLTAPDVLWTEVASRQFSLTTGTTVPDDADGQDGDIYFQYEV